MQQRTAIATAPNAADLAIDPVCGMKVNPGTTAHRFAHGCTTYHFWFLLNPGREWPARVGFAG